MNAPARTELRRKAKQGIDRADDMTVRMILAMLDVQEDQEVAFEQEMERRIKEYERGTVAPITLDQLEASARAAHKKRMKAAK